MNDQKRLGELSIIKLLMEFSIPAMIGMMVNTLYNIIDRIFIGHIPDIGNMAIAGVGITMPISTIILAFGMLIGVGTATRISIKLGQHERVEAEKHLGNAFTLIFIISALVTIVGLAFTDQILKAFGASENTLIYAEQYIQIIFYGTVFNIIGFGLNHSIRSDGSPRIAMLSMLIGAITNIVLDPIFIFTLGLGVRGGAIATVISQFVSAIWVLYYFTKGKSILKIKKKYLKLDRKIVISIFAIGISPFSMQLAQCAVQVISNNALQMYGGDSAVAAMTVINSLSLIFLMPIYGINQGVQPIIGYNYGAQKFDRVKEAVKYAVIGATVIVTLGFFVIEIFPKQLIYLFNNDPELLSMGARGMRIYLCTFPFIGCQIIAMNYFQSTGKVKISMFLSLLRQIIILIPCIIIIPKFLGLTGIWIAGPVSDMIALVITIIVFVKDSKELWTREDSFDNAVAG